MIAAEVLDDEMILNDIRGKDVVVIEVRYHKSCFKNYTRVLSKEGSREGPARYHSYKDAFEKFCSSVIEEQILKKCELLRLTTLREHFVKIVRDIEDHEDNVELSTSFLKEKLKRPYSRLQFIRPSRRNASEIVCVEETIGILAE